MEIAGFMGLNSISVISLLAAIVVAIAFEAVNGFHDAANAVATVIYTNSLSPRSAVLLSGVCNFLGVYIGGVGVAFAIVHLLPVNLLVNCESTSGLAMIFAILIAAITWNVGTWYKGIPASSSHTLIGAIIGVSLANGFLQGGQVFQGKCFGNLEAVILSLIISPLLGFALAAIMLKAFRIWVRDRELYESPGDRKPPRWVRSMLVCTSAGVSLAHGSNDGQKGVGLIMIILIGILPGYFALNPQYRAQDSQDVAQSLQKMARAIEYKQNGVLGELDGEETGVRFQLVTYQSPTVAPIAGEIEEMAHCLAAQDLKTVAPDERGYWRKRILLLEDHIKTLDQSGAWDLTSVDKTTVKRVRTELRSMTDYAPTWVILLVAACIGMGTTVGWKRVVITVGEKLGRSPLNYAQGASSQMVAMMTIGFADVLGLPVSTTHVLSSGVTGTMVANGVGLKYGTIRTIVLAWALTLPVTILLGAALFFLFNFLVGA